MLEQEKLCSFLNTFFCTNIDIQIERFLSMVNTIARSVVSEDNYLGLTRPLYLTCNLCKNQYDAIIMMETYTEDSR